MSIPPLSPRRRICDQLEGMLPCNIAFDQGSNAYRTELDEHSDIKQIFDEAVEYLKRSYEEKLLPPSGFTVRITAQKNSDSEALTMLYNPNIIQIPDATFCDSRSGSPTPNKEIQ